MRAAGRDRAGGRAVALVVALAGLLLVTACTSGSDLATPAAPVGSGGVEPPAAGYVAIGGVETLNRSRDDIQDNWPQVVFAENLPAGAVYVNLATEDATTESALADQVPKAVGLRPTVATVWVEAADVRGGTPRADYRDRLREIVTRLQAVGVRVLLLTPSASQPDLAGAYADDVHQVADETGAVFVDLGDTSGRQDDPGQRQIADAVIAAMGAT